MSASTKTKFADTHCDIFTDVLARRSLSIARVAEMVGTDASKLSKIIRGLSPLTPHQLEKFQGAGLLTASEMAQCRRIATAHAIAASRGMSGAEEPDEPLDPAQVRRISAARKKMERAEVRETKRGRFFVTCVVQGAPVRASALAAVRQFCELRKAKPVFLPLKAHLRPLSDVEYPLDDVILEDHWRDVYKSLRFNQHLTALDFDLRPYKADPLIGLAPYGATDAHSYLFAHTTQRESFLPNPKGKHPRIQYTTGAITEPTYYDTTSGEMAFDRHVMGGLIVEIDRDFFAVRRVQFAADGSFYDLADGDPCKYTAQGAEPARARLLSRGDDHGGPGVWGDAVANEAVEVLTGEVQPDVVTVEDVFDGASINPHAAHSISQVLGTPHRAVTLAAEGEETADHLRRIRASMRPDAELVVKGANHSRFLNRYLDGGKWTQDRTNYLIALDLAVAYHKRKMDPVRVLIDPENAIGLKWLEPEESYVVEGIECGFHLDEGTNGGPASNRSHAVAHGRAIGGHVHAPATLWGITRTGTLTKLRQGYNSGPSSWAHAVALVWPGGQVQLVVIIAGRFRL